MQSYNRDLFIFLYFLLIIVSAMTSFTIHNEKSPLTGKSILYLNRHQTEEWKGWMQVMYLYFFYNECLFIRNKIMDSACSVCVIICRLVYDEQDRWLSNTFRSITR